MQLNSNIKVKIMKVLIPFILLTISTFSVSAQSTSQGNIQLSVRASCQVITRGNSVSFIGSGVCIYKDKTNVTILTNYHTFREATPTYFQSCDGSFCRNNYYYATEVGFLHGWYKGWMVKSSPSLDLALISLRLNDTSAFSVVKIPFSNKPKGPVHTISCADTEFQRLNGAVLDQQKVNYVVPQGCSGAGVFDGDYLVGLIWGTDHQTVSYYVNLVTIKNFLKTPLSVFTDKGKIIIPNPEYETPPVSITPVAPIPQKEQPKAEQPKAIEPKVIEQSILASIDKKHNDLVKQLSTQTSTITKQFESKSLTQEKAESIIHKIDTATTVISGVSTVVGYAVPGVGLIGLAAGVLGMMAKGAVNKRVSSQPQPQPQQYPQPSVYVGDINPQVTDNTQYRYSPFPIHTQHPPSPPVVHTETVTVPVEVDNTSKAFAYAKQQMAVTNPGSLGTLETVESIMKQFTSGQDLYSKK